MKKILGNVKHIMSQLENRKKRLELIVSSKYPIDPKLKDAHENRVAGAKLYLEELEELLLPVDTGINCMLVPKQTFEKQIGKADFARLEMDGEYCKLAIIENYPFESLWLIYLAPLERL